MTTSRAKFLILLPVSVFVLAYFCTTVLGNILYDTPIGDTWPTRSMPDFKWSQFQQPFGFGFWILLLSPLAVTPFLSLIIAARSRPLIERIEKTIPELSKGFFATVNCICIVYIAYSLYRAGATTKLLAGENTLDAVRYRFSLQSDLGLLPRFVLMSALQFLSIYAIVKSIRTRQAYWIAFATINITAVSAFLILINMKWPIIVFELTIAAAALVCIKKRFILASSITLLLCLLTYFAISFALLRVDSSTDFAPEAHPAMVSPFEKQGSKDRLPEILAKKSIPQFIYRETKRGDEKLVVQTNKGLPFYDVVLNLIIVAINRLAMTAPFYYDIFTTYGQICGSFFDRVILRRASSCHPSILVYSQMFPNDGFNGRGTAPAAHQIYEYARGGWVGAIVALVIGALIIGIYTACYFIRYRDIFIAIFVMGIPASYMLSQLPVDSTIISETGALWWIGIILLNAGLLWANRKIRIFS